MPHNSHHAQAKAKAAKEKAIYDLNLSNLRGDSRLEWKEEIAAKKAARDPRRVLKRWVAIIQRDAIRVVDAKLHCGTYPSAFVYNRQRW